MYGDIILELIHEFQKHFPRNLRHSVGMLNNYKDESECSFQFRNLRSHVT